MHLSDIPVEDRFPIVPIFGRRALLSEMCIVNNYILLTSETKIPFSKEEFFKHFAKTELFGVSVILTSADISSGSPGNYGTSTRTTRFILTRGTTEFQLQFTDKGHIDTEYELRKYSLEGIVEETEDLEWFSSYFCSDAYPTNKLYLEGYRVYHNKISRKDAYNLHTSGDRGFIIVELEHNTELRIYNISANHSRCAMYIVDAVDDGFKEYVHKTIMCSEGLYLIKGLVLTFPPIAECQDSDLVGQFDDKAFGMYAMINGCLPYK